MPKQEMPSGALVLLILRVLRSGPLHGYAIATAIRGGSGDAVRIEFGSLYPALKRLELKEWIAARWERSEHNRRAKVYRLTPAGRRQLRQETSEWEAFTAGVARLMKPAFGETD